MFLGKAKACET